MAVWAQQTFLQEGSRVEEQRGAPSPRLCSLLCTSRPIGGAMTSRSCRPRSPSVPALLFFWAVLFHIAPSVVLNKQLQAPAL